MLFDLLGKIRAFLGVVIFFANFDIFDVLSFPAIMFGKFLILWENIQSWAGLYYFPECADDTSPALSQLRPGQAEDWWDF